MAPLPRSRRRRGKKGGSGPGGAKRTKLIDILTSSPLRSTGESEDDRGKGSPAAVTLPLVTAQPLSAVAPMPKPPLILEYSAMEPESDDELTLKI